ncbi:sucrose-6-phosphate hydrolase [Photobacterium rosenbergii]|uniref:Sucrose-6-phosphate hydrolase n=1 Tax=Photobacterium rosenbergii TaxID=294936 RepID=A0ABU3ZJT6_9GAMM|nr:sucrose-6-phosphate hydrolase [Photobacterium rosenbergii]MDV5170362.1 sucrose-6-phosphate hydrolase [Photobacterium rosenbergii]
MIDKSNRFRALGTAKPGELENLRQQMLAQDTDYLPAYHIAPKTGHLNDPNGMVFDGEKYHLFYQWFPFGPFHGMKHWKYLITKDFIHFEEGDVLAPENEFETHGIYSGGAICIDGFIYCFYSGNVMNEDGETFSQNQNVAKYSTDGKLLDRWNIVPEAPTGYTGNFRDPSPFINEEGELMFVVGAQREGETGATLLYKMTSLTQAELVGEVSYGGKSDLAQQADVYMHECPDISHSNGKDLFILSPMGLKPQAERYNNIFSTQLMIGQYQRGEMHAEQVIELDKGFDFYAPQTFTDSERNIMLAWCGNGSLSIPTELLGWKFMLTMPRELVMEGSKLIQRPLAEFNQLKQPLVTLEQPGRYDIDGNLSQSYITVDVIADQAFSLTLFEDSQYKLILTYQDGSLLLDRSQTIETDDMKRFGSERTVKLESLQQLEIFIDNSVIEIFINGGEEVMTSRFFIPNRSHNMAFDGAAQVSISEMSAISLY